jgi:hypothetical protein
MNVNRRLKALENRLHPVDDTVRIIYLSWDTDDDIESKDEVITKEEYLRRFGSEPVDTIRLSWEVDDG